MASQLGVVQWAKVEVWQLRVGGLYEVKFNEGLAPISAMTPGRFKGDGVSNTGSSSRRDSSAKIVFRKSSPYSTRPASKPVEFGRLLHGGRGCLDPVNQFS